MELIAIDENMHEIGNIIADVDIELGTSAALNNFEMSIPPIDAAGFYVEGTEYGGLFEFTSEKSTGTVINYKGWTWRGLLTQGVIMPPQGSDYYYASGDANAIISSLLANAFGGFFNVPGTNSGCTVNNYKFPLYINLLDGIMGMLEEYGYRLSIHAEKTAAGEPVQVTVEAVEMEMAAGTQNEDSPYTITVSNDRMGINHLICLGSGSLRHRDRIDLYIDQSGNVAETQYFTGFEERTAIYDYASVESHADLKSGGIKRLRELASTKKIEVNIKSDTDAGHRIEIGDNVRAALRGDTVVTKVIQKVVKISNGVETVSYKTSSEQ